MRKSNITRDEAFALLRKYNKEPFHIQHALTVEGVMRRYAEKLGCGDEADYWGIVGLLHDIDFELYPDEHCKKSARIACRRRCWRGYDTRRLLTRLWDML